MEGASRGLKQYFDLRAMRRTATLLQPYMLRYWKSNVGLLLLMILDILLTLGFAWFYGAVTDAAIHARMDRLRALLLIGVGMLAASILFAYFNTVLEARVAGGVKAALRQDLYKHIMLLPLKDWNSRRAGDVLTHFSIDVESASGIVGRDLLELLRVPVIYGTVFVYLWSLQWQLAMLAAAAAPIALASGAVLGLMVRRNNHAASEANAQLSGWLKETVDGFLTIRSYLLEKRMYAGYTALSQELLQLEMKNARIRGAFYAGGEGIGILVFLCSMGIGAYLISKDALTVGVLVTFINLVGHLIHPLNGLAGQWAAYQHSIVATERLSRVLDLRPEGKWLPTRVEAPHMPLAIELSGVQFRYDPAVPIFESLSLVIPAGKITAIVGRSGSGKTTLFYLLQGLFKPDAGTIHIHGEPIDSYSPQGLRSMFSYVSQDTFLFNDTIRANLAAANEQATDQDLYDAAAASDIHGFILSLPDGYDTVIGDGGVQLSGGQRQRLSIARAILRNAPILLLDEATSALDLETESQVREAVARLMQNRTTVMITHRISLIQDADLILVMNQGKLVQSGRHEDLVRQDGPYRTMCRIGGPRELVREDEVESEDERAYSSVV